MTGAAPITALIVEDEPLARRRLRELIHKVPWLERIGEASEGQSAIVAIDELQPDLVFLDVRLPGISGVERFSRALERARPWLQRRDRADTAERAQEMFGQGEIPRLFVREGGQIVPIRVSSIESLEACDDYVVVHARGRQARINLPLAELERRLDPRVFVRVHRCHIVNLDHVASWTPYDGSRFQITLRSGATILASRQRSRLLRDMSR